MLVNIKTIPTGVSKLSDAVKNEVVKKTEYDELVKKVNAIDTSGVFKKNIIILRSKILKIKYPVLLT